jgi:hypothetical protein
VFGRLIAQKNRRHISNIDFYKFSEVVVHISKQRLLNLMRQGEHLALAVTGRALAVTASAGAAITAVAVGAVGLVNEDEGVLHFERVWLFEVVDTERGRGRNRDLRHGKTVSFRPAARRSVVTLPLSPWFGLPTVKFTQPSPGDQP